MIIFLVLQFMIGATNVAYFMIGRSQSPLICITAAFSYVVGFLCPACHVSLGTICLYVRLAGGSGRCRSGHVLGQVDVHS